MAAGGRQDALVENRTREVEKKLKDAEKLLKEQKQKAYINPELAAVEKEKGNALVKEGKFVEAKVDPRALPNVCWQQCGWHAVVLGGWRGS